MEPLSVLNFFFIFKSLPFILIFSAILAASWFNNLGISNTYPHIFGLVSLCLTDFFKGTCCVFGLICSSS